METGNETASRECRFLSEMHFDALYATFTEAFSDYVFPFALTEKQFRNHINLNGVDLERTAGCFEGGKLVGFSLNGFGKWQGHETVYDAGTGVIPAARRKGVSEAMFDMMLPRLQADGVTQCLLEVVTTNTGAIRLYEKLGFKPVRELALLQCDGAVKPTASRPNDVVIEQIDEPDWEKISSYRDGRPSWQNSDDALRRCINIKRVLGAFVDGNCVGYLIFSVNFGRMAQMAVDPKYRNRGIGTLLLQRMQEMTLSGYSIQIINLDNSLDEAMRFFRDRGFYERLVQYEMVLSL
jgi:ribosomal protein S18 acetylase RimI-like enzyme